MPDIPVIRKVFYLTDEEWDELQTLLNEPSAHTPKLSALLGSQTVTDSHSAK